MTVAPSSSLYSFRCQFEYMLIIENNGSVIEIRTQERKNVKKTIIKLRWLLPAQLSLQIKPDQTKISFPILQMLDIVNERDAFPSTNIPIKQASIVYKFYHALFAFAKILSENGDKHFKKLVSYIKIMMT